MEEFRIGEVIEILGEPSQWASKLCDNDPLDLDYPITIEVIDIKPDSCHNPMIGREISTGIEYGFDYDAILRIGFRNIKQLKMSYNLVTKIIKNS